MDELKKLRRRMAEEQAQWLGAVQAGSDTRRCCGETFRRTSSGRGKGHVTKPVGLNSRVVLAHRVPREFRPKARRWDAAASDVHYYPRSRHWLVAVRTHSYRAIVALDADRGLSLKYTFEIEVEQWLS